MKAISLWQPWATLIAIGAKKIETRGWSARYRGPLVICATKRKPVLSELNMHIIKALHDAGYSRIDQLPLGKIVAVSHLYDIKSTSICCPGQPEESFGNYAEGRFAWLLKDVLPLEVPITYPGSQGFFEVPDEVINAAVKVEFAPPADC